MKDAVANPPHHHLETHVPKPHRQQTPEEENYGDQPPDMNDIGPMMVDENGMPIITPPPGTMNFPQQQPMVQPDGSGPPTQQELDQAFPPQPQQQRPQPQQPAVRRPPGYVPPRQPPPRQPDDPSEPQAGSAPPADAPEPGAYPA
jgi:penicillin-binding protein 1A